MARHILQHMSAGTLRMAVGPGLNMMAGTATSSTSIMGGGKAGTGGTDITGDGSAGWWIVGPDWYWYPEAVYPYPNPFLPPGQAPGFWYWCDAYQQYYPYVGACPSGWRAVPPQ
jgi:hypothetical protein